ncbi:hypothetical protein WAI453_008861 [Rhynchosporium graminicola]
MENQHSHIIQEECVHRRESDHGNPLGWLRNEVLCIHGPSRPTSTFLSIGTGMPSSEEFSGVRNPVAFAKSKSVAGAEENRLVIVGSHSADCHHETVIP